MPAKKQIGKEEITAAAVRIIRKRGLAGLNVRDVAKECKCSTQPIYHTFGSVEGLKSAVNVEIAKIFDSFLQAEIDKKLYPEYKAVGMGYIRFAKDEKELFKFLFMRDRTDEDNTSKYGLDEAALIIMKNYGLYKDDSVRLHIEMWAFVHGIATMFATDYLDWEWKMVEDMVTDAFIGISSRIKGEKNDN